MDGLLLDPDFVVDFKAAALLPGKAFAGMVIDLLSDDAKAKKIWRFQTRRSPKQYIAKLDGYFSEEEPDHD